MHEYTSPGEVDVPPEEHLTTALWEAARSHPDRPAVAVRAGDRFVEWTTRQFADEVRAVAKGLVSLGVQPGNRICIHSSTRLEWTILDYAAWTIGAVIVPIYETSSPDQISWILKDSEAKVLVTEDAALRGVVEDADGVDDLEHLLVIDDGALQALKQQGSPISDSDLDARNADLSGETIATIVYTSGTTGRPKGCVITHHSFVWDGAQVASAEQAFFNPGKRTLLFLPLAHIFARVIQTTCIRRGVLLGYSTGIPYLVEELKIFTPDFLIAVPRVFEKVFNGARQKAHSDGKGAIFDRAAAVAEAYSRQQQDGSVKLGTRIQHALFDKLVYGKLRDAMGGNVKHAVSGGAALGDRIAHFFNGIGIMVLEAYGLTENTAGACINRPHANRIGTVGQPVPGGSVRIANDGEVLLKGPHVFAGYLDNPEATSQSFTEDGWLRTGDIGSLDADGFLRLTGRKKEILVTAGGKNVAPAILEDRMRAHALVSQSMVIGDGQPFISALITVDPEAFEVWADQNGKKGKTVADLVDDEDLRGELQKAVDEANQAVSKAESIRTFRILPEDFEVGVELSQKMSVKRHVVGEKYQDVIDDIYAATSR